MKDVLARDTLRPLSLFPYFEQYGNATDNLPRKQRGANDIGTYVNRASRIASLLHCWNGRHSHCPQNNQSCSRIQVRSREEFSGASVRIQRTLRIGRNKQNEAESLNQTRIEIKLTSIAKKVPKNAKSAP